RPITGPTERVYPPGYSSAWWATKVSDGTLAPFPVGVAQRALQELPCRLARQFLDEIDRAGPLELGEPSREVIHDPLAQRVVGDDAGARLDDRFDLLAHVVVGDSEHGDVADVGVREDLALDLRGIDVHSPGDDHVGLAIAEE